MIKKKSIKKIKSHVKKGDTVLVLCGKDKGRTGVVSSVQLSRQKAVVEGVNQGTKHYKPGRDREGGIEQINKPIHLSNIKLVASKEG